MRRDRDRERERRDRRSRSRSRSRSKSPRSSHRRSPVYMSGPSGKHDGTCLCFFISSFMLLTKHKHHFMKIKDSKHCCLNENHWIFVLSVPSATVYMVDMKFRLCCPKHS